MRNKRRKFSKEFKEEALRLVEKGERSISEVAASLDVHESLLSKWRRTKELDKDEAFRGSGKKTAEADETWRLKKEVKELRQELEFLKKVSRYFAK